MPLRYDSTMAKDEERSQAETAKPRSCPICGKPAATRFRPFCSARCQTIDLARWIGGSYRVPDQDPEKIGNDEADDA
jgi:uncharacterized protein